MIVLRKYCVDQYALKDVDQSNGPLWSLCCGFVSCSPQEVMVIAYVSLVRINCVKSYVSKMSL